jgi:hypothetical protein
VDRVLVVSWRDFGGDGQLRRRHRAMPPEAREIAAWDLVNVEAIPFDALTKGITRRHQELRACSGAVQRRSADRSVGDNCVPFLEAERLRASVLARSAVTRVFPLSQENFLTTGVRK